MIRHKKYKALTIIFLFLLIFISSSEAYANSKEGVFPVPDSIIDEFEEYLKDPVEYRNSIINSPIYKSYNLEMKRILNERKTNINAVSGTNNLPFERYVLHDIAMPVKHQKYLYDLCEAKGLDYLKTLAILKHESQFQVDLVHSNNNGTKDYGYMQVNSCNHDNFAKELGTPKAPLDPYINMHWGTHELQKLKKHYMKQGLTGRELFESIQSGYNKGIYGFQKYGKAIRYIGRTDRELNWLINKLNL